MTHRYSIGIDFGTLSARAVLLDLATGKDAAVSEFSYPHGVLSSDYFGMELPAGASFQHPQDYLDAMGFVFRDLFARSGAKPEEVCGVGIDFTASTTLPVTENGTPLCFFPELQNEPYAYVTLWNHHGATPEAERLTAVAAQRHEPWLAAFSGKISPDNMLPKLYELLHKAPHIYSKTDRYMEAADWVLWQLIGEEKRTASMAGFKAQWTPEYGYPSNDYFAAVDPGLAGIIGTKIPVDVYPAGTCAGKITEEAAKLAGLHIGTQVTFPIIDSHAPICAAGIIKPGQLMMSLGTSGCHIIMSDDAVSIPGVLGRIRSSVVPGLVTYDASQPSTGNTFAWFVKNCIPERYAQEASEKGQSIFQLLMEKAQLLPPGSNGLVAVDWFNGNRCPYSDFDLSGAIVGLTLKTKPEEIYRALIESCAFAARSIADLYRSGNITITDIFAGGGIAQKNPMLMQIYADVMNMPIKVTVSSQAGAKGDAIFAAVAGGAFVTLEDAVAALADPVDQIYYPIAENVAAYDRLYCEYMTLCKYFGEENLVMKRLKEMTK